MLAGVGGRTIAEAQCNISHAEFMSWVSYRNKRGTLNLGLRTDRGFAMLAMLYANSKRERGSRAFKIIDFEPYADEPELTLERAMQEWY